MQHSKCRICSASHHLAGSISPLCLQRSQVSKLTLCILFSSCLYFHKHRCMSVLSCFCFSAILCLIDREAKQSNDSPFSSFTERLWRFRFVCTSLAVFWTLPMGVNRQSQAQWPGSLDLQFGLLGLQVASLSSSQTRPLFLLHYLPTALVQCFSNTCKSLLLLRPLPLHRFPL